MFNIGSGELLVVLLIGLIVLGPDKLPETARKISGMMRDLRRMSQGFQDEMRQAVDLADLEREFTGRGAGPSLPPLTEAKLTETSPTKTSPTKALAAPVDDDGGDESQLGTDEDETGSGKLSA